MDPSPGCYTVFPGELFGRNALTTTILGILRSVNATGFQTEILSVLTLGKRRKTKD